MKKSPEITDATRNKLIQAFCELYKKKSISKITVKEITDIAGYNRSTFYQYFNDVFALLEYAENEMIATGAERVSSFELEADNFTQQFMLGFSEALREHEHYTVLILRNGTSSDFFRKIEGYIIPVIMKRYDIAEDNTKAVYALKFYLTGMLSMLTHWLEKPDALTIEELGSLIQGIWYDGMLAQLK